MYAQITRNRKLTIEKTLFWEIVLLQINHEHRKCYFNDDRTCHFTVNRILNLYKKKTTKMNINDLNSCRKMKFLMKNKLMDVYF